MYYALLIAWYARITTRYSLIITLWTLITSILSSCGGNKEIEYVPQEKVDPYKIYEEGLEAFNTNDFFFASEKFSEAEFNFSSPDYAAKAAIMSSYSLYVINFYDEALENLNRYLKIYPSDKNIIYLFSI